MDVCEFPKVLYRLNEIGERISRVFANEGSVEAGWMTIEALRRSGASQNVSDAPDLVRGLRAVAEHYVGAPRLAERSTGAADAELMSDGDTGSNDAAHVQRERRARRVKQKPETDSVGD